MRLDDYLFGGKPIGMSHRDRDGKPWAADNIHQIVAGPLPDQYELCKGFIAAPCRFEELRRVTVNGKRYAARGWDTSDRPNVYRLTEDAMPVSLWCPLDMEPDEWFRREATVERYNYATGAKVAGPDTHVTWLCLDDIIFEWHNPGGTYVGKVIRLTVHDGEDGKGKPPFEEYIYAEKYGMVYWKDHATGRESYVNNTVWPNGVPLLKAEPLPAGKQYQPMAAAPVVPPPPAGWYWHRPVRAPFVVTSPYGMRPTPEQNDGDKTELHTGTDYAGLSDWNAYAAREGKVVFAGWNEYGYGNLVTIDHGGGYESLYGHLESVSVAVGATVSAGQKIGVIGSTGRSTARHLHWGVRKNGVFYAPAPETRPHPLDIAPPVIPEPPAADHDTTPTQPIEVPPPLFGHITVDEAHQLAVLFSQASNIYATIEQRMRGN